MKKLILIMLFGKTVVLTPEPVTLEGRMELVPDEPLTVVTSGAHIQIDVSSMIGRKGGEGVFSVFERVEKRIPPGTISAKLVSEDGEEVNFSYRGAKGVSGSSVKIGLHAEGGAPTEMRFKKVIIKSENNLTNVQVYWKNYMH